MQPTLQHFIIYIHFLEEPTSFLLYYSALYMYMQIQFIFFGQKKEAIVQSTNLSSFYDGSLFVCCRRRGEITFAPFVVQLFLCENVGYLREKPPLQME